MPKTRNTGNTIASRPGNNAGSPSLRESNVIRDFSGGGGLGGIIGSGVNDDDDYNVDDESIANEEMSGRIQERLSQVGSVTVLMESVTRDRMENVVVDFSEEPGIAEVHSESGNDYTVNFEEETCTCLHHRMRQARCRHIEAVSQAQQQAVRGFEQGSRSSEDVNVNNTIAQVNRNEISEELSNSNRQFVDDNHFYTEEPEAFESDFRAAATSEIPYEYENALNGSDITFGVELEFVGGDSGAIARELYEMGLFSHDQRIPYHAFDRGIYRPVPGKWHMEEDVSVCRGEMGGEIVSPVLRDTPETWRQIQVICEVARRHGATVDQKTGGHIHIGVDPLDGKRQRWRRLFKTFKGNEEAILRLSGGELGRFRASTYARSSQEEMSRGLRMALPEEGSLEDFSRALRPGRFDKYYNLNISPFSKGVRNAIEVRAFNGSLTPGVIQANVKTAAALIHTAERSRIRGEDEGLTTESFKKRGMMINEMKNQRNNEGIMTMLDTFFTRKTDKQHILSVIAKNDWRP